MRATHGLFNLGMGMKVDTTGLRVDGYSMPKVKFIFTIPVEVPELTGYLKAGNPVVMDLLIPRDIYYREIRPAASSRGTRKVSDIYGVQVGEVLTSLQPIFAVVLARHVGRTVICRIDSEDPGWRDDPMNVYDANRLWHRHVLEWKE